MEINNMYNQVTSEEAVAKIGNRYDLILIASIRARELKKGYVPMVTRTSKSNAVTALQEIEAGIIGKEYLRKVK